MTAYTDSTEGTYPKFDLQKKRGQKIEKEQGLEFRNGSIFN